MMMDIHEHPEGTLTPLPELTPRELDRYLPEFKRRHRPVLLRGYHRDDPALGTWSFESFMDRLPDQTVDLDIGDSMVSDGLTFTVITSDLIA